jgi:hypothetical protein
VPYHREDDTPDSCWVNERTNRCEYAEEAADKAVEKMVARLFGVDPNDPEKIKKVQNMHSFVERLEKMAEKGVFGAVATLSGLLVTALVVGLIAFKTKFIGP